MYQIICTFSMIYVCIHYLYILYNLYSTHFRFSVTNQTHVPLSKTPGKASCNSTYSTLEKQLRRPNLLAPKVTPKVAQLTSLFNLRAHSASI